MRNKEATHTVANDPRTGCVGLYSVGRNARDNPVIPREVEEERGEESTVQIDTQEYIHKTQKVYLTLLQAMLGNLNISVLC